MYVRGSSCRPGARALAATLMLTILGGCSEDDPTGPAQVLPPAESGAELESVDARASAVANWADGYAWANSPSLASYTPISTWAYNRSGGAITITRQGPGTYKVRFAGLSATLANRSTVHVTGYNADNKYCKPATQNLKADVIGIKCFDAATGRPEDAYYTVYITKRYGDVAFAVANKATATNYVPPANASHNPSGAIRVFRSGVGVYTVKFAGLGSKAITNGGHVQVVAVGTGAQHCKVGSWSRTADIDISVLCFSRAGAFKDVKFNVFFALPHPTLAYAWASSPSSSSYLANTHYATNPTGGNVTISRSGVGRYTVAWSGLTLNGGGDVQVTAYGGGNIVCKVENWGSASANVRCFNPQTNALVDSQFDIMFFS
jgi:hypothetical protein